MKYLLLDVAGTLLGKPTLLPTMIEALSRHGHQVDQEKLKYHHKIFSETIFFPDRTSEAFYQNFNRELLLSVGIIPTDEVLKDVFGSCSYLPWVPFADTEVLKDIQVPMGIISNFNTTLKDKLEANFNVTFAHVLVSEELGIHKPSVEFYRRAIDQIGLPPEDIVYVGDSIKLDLEPALKMGLRALLVDRDDYFPLQKNRIRSLADLKNIG